MVIAIGVLLALVCLAVAAIPFLKYRHSRQTVDPLQVISELQSSASTPLQGTPHLGRK